MYKFSNRRQGSKESVTITSEDVVAKNQFHYLYQLYIIRGNRGRHDK